MSLSTRCVALALLAIVSVSAPARAEEIKTLEVTGDADAGASDSRSIAVDAAFAQAAQEALEELLSREQRAEHRAVLNKEIIGRARRWVASYRVTGDRTEGGRRQLVVAVRLDRRALRDRLGELQILDAAAASDAPGAAPVHGDPRWAGRTATLLLRLRREALSVATFGAAAEEATPGAAAGATLMLERGLLVNPAAEAPAPRASGELPLDDDEARAAATAANAELAVVVGVELSARQQVRGVATPMVLARAAAKLVAATGGGGGAGQGAAVGIAGDGDRDAIDRAVTRAIAGALPLTTAARPVAELTSDDRPLPAVDGGEWVRVSPSTPWSVVAATLRAVNKQAGFSAELRRLSPAGYLILVRAAERLDRLSAIVRAVPLPPGSGALKVRRDGGALTVRVEAK